MKIKKNKIIKLWNEGELKKKYKIKMNYQNWVEIYNNKGKIIAGVMYRPEQEIIFEIIEENLIESNWKKINERQKGE